MQEAEAFSEVYEFGTKDVKTIALKISQLPKINPDTKRLVIITQGHLPVIVARGKRTIHSFSYLIYKIVFVLFVPFSTLQKFAWIFSSDVYTRGSSDIAFIDGLKCRKYGIFYLLQV